jgi:beta-glucanase (GH16 family)
MLDNRDRARSQRRSFYGTALLLVLATCSIRASAQTPASHLPAHNDYQLVYSDEFDETALDRSKWCTRLAFGGGAALQIPDAECTGPGGFRGSGDFLRDERQRYVDTNTLGEIMHVVSDGTLKLRATRTRPDDSWANYEAGMVRSKYAFAPASDAKYFISTRVRLPNVRGTFVAMWLAPSFTASGDVVWPPEIDTFEGALNEAEDKANMLRLGGVYVKGPQTDSGNTEVSYSTQQYDKTWSNYYAPASLRDVWVEIGVEWTTTGACTFVDGTVIVCQNYRWVTEANAPGSPAQLIMNLAVGGQWAGRNGIADPQFPTAMEIDYVRIWKDSNPVASPLPEAGGGTTPNSMAGASAGSSGMAGGAAGSGGELPPATSSTLSPTTPPAADNWSFFGRFFIPRR